MGHKESNQTKKECHEFVPKGPSLILTGFYSEEGDSGSQWLVTSLDMLLVVSIYGPLREKTCLWGLQPRKACVCPQGA